MRSSPCPPDPTKPPAPEPDPDAALRLLSWTQDSESAFVRVRVPRGTRAREVLVDATPSSLRVRLDWLPESEAFGGALRETIVASETLWTLETDGTETLVSVVLQKTERDVEQRAWRGLFENYEEKSLQEVLLELTNADERSPAHSALTHETQHAIEEMRERRYQMGCGEFNPDEGFDDFRLVIKN